MAPNPPTMVEDDTAFVAALVVPELLLLGVAFAVVAGSLLGWTTLLTGYDVPLRVAALVFLALEILIPVGVYADLRRRPDETGLTWVHAAAVPVVNLVGVVAYLEERGRNRDA